ncbi:MAG: trypsin-like peptidase domain-containing protein [Clostridia bacterium]|nr:trypsin-like peptidase domain-containing protein [Clostridia bacterium]
MKCPACGEEATLGKGGKYRCPYCTHEFEMERPAPAPAPSYVASTAPARAEDGTDVFESNVNGVLELFCDFGNVGASGSGFLIDKSGLAITNAHVVLSDEGKPSKQIVARVAGEKVGAALISADVKHDLALIVLKKVGRNAKVLKFGDFKKVRTGQKVFVIGNSLGDGTCITAGIVSDKSRDVNGQTLMMTDCQINGGNSGGPIFNADGEVIGVIVAQRLMEDGSCANGMKYAIPAPTALSFIEANMNALKKIFD